MDPHERQASSAGRKTADSSGITSPADTQYPARREDEGLSESFQSTDTVRRRPEGYGKFVSNPTGSSRVILAFQDR